MTGLTVVRCTRVGDWMRRARRLLEDHEAEHTMLYSLSRRLATEAVPDPYLALALDGDAVVGCAVGAASARVALSRTEAAAAPVLADDMAEALKVLAPVHVPADIAGATVRRLEERSGRHGQLVMEQRHFQTSSVSPPADVAGALRRAVEDDRTLLEDWVGAFLQEALHESASRAGDTVQRWLGNGGDDGHLVVWEVDGEPVSMAGFTGPTPNGITVLSVYTPPEHRGRGYAGACVAALTQRLLDSGRRRVFLSTDLANPTSNRIYVAMGYEPVGDSAVYRFS